jgi:PhnB protein
MPTVKPVPAGYSTVTPYMIVRNAAEALEWYKKALGAQELVRMPGPDGRIMHAEIKIGDSPIMVCDEMLEFGAKSPQTVGGSPISLFLYLEDCDATYKQAVENGATGDMPPADQFWGDRWGRFTDPYGHSWSVATHKEDLTPEEMERRRAELGKAGSA